jgi:F0F1-type ATP synthase assembly protein I
MFDKNKMKEMEKMLKGFPMMTPNQNPFDFSKIKKLLLLVSLSLFVSGFVVGLLIGLLF